MARKRALNGSGTQPRLRSDGRWEGRIKIGIDPGTGKPITKYVYAKTAEDCRKQIAEVVAEVDKGTYQEPERMKLQEWLKTWYDEYCMGIKDSTRKTYETQLRVHIIPSLGAIRLCNLRTPDIQKFINDLCRGTKKAAPVSAKTAKNNFGILHRALEQAVKVGYLKSNPANGCNLPRIKKAEIQPMDDGAIRRFLERIKGDRIERLLIVDLFTGLRKSELLGLTWNCIDFEKGAIRVYRQLQFLNGKYTFSTLKNDKPRTLFPPEFVMKALKEQKRAQMEQQLKVGVMWSNTEGFVFTNEIGGHLLHQTVYKQFKRIAKEINMPSLRFHDLRHSYAVTALKHGDNVKNVQENLGHATAAFTLNTYGHATEEMKRESAMRMDAAIADIINA